MSHQASGRIGDQDSGGNALAGGAVARRWGELLVLFFLVPGFLDLRWFGRNLIPMLIAIALVILVVLLRDKAFERSRLWVYRGWDALGSAGGPPGVSLKREWARILSIWLIGAGAITGFLVLYAPERLFGFVRSEPVVWAFVMVLYPVLSAWPQGVVFRCFFFHRYAGLFARPWQLVAVGALAFGWAHIVLENWIAVAFCVVGGVLFGITYHRTRSNLIATAEQALYGGFIWTIGLGWYFYSKGVVAG